MRERKTKSARIVLAGASGFIGSHLLEALSAQGYELVLLTRNPDTASEKLRSLAECVAWDGKTVGAWQQHLEGAAAVINLSGENVAGRPWTKKFQRRILESRTGTAEAISNAIIACSKRPAVLLQASAIGYYGHRHDELLNEGSGLGRGFMAEVCDTWENCVEALLPAGVRRVYLRIGIVLGNGGVLSRLEMPFKYYVGGHPGDGTQWLSWIHIDDIVNAIGYLLEQDKLSGAFNMTAPNPVRISGFCEKLGKKLKRPSWAHIPKPLLKLAPGKMAEETFLVSQCVTPKRLTDAGFTFEFAEVDEALDAIYG